MTLNKLAKSFLLKIAKIHFIHRTHFIEERIKFTLKQKGCHYLGMCPYSECLHSDNPPAWDLIFKIYLKSDRMWIHDGGPIGVSIKSCVCKKSSYIRLLNLSSISDHLDHKNVGKIDQRTLVSVSFTVFTDNTAFSMLKLRNFPIKSSNI